MKSQQIEHYLALYRDGLLKDVVPFWESHSPDRQYGGFLTCLTEDGTPFSTDKPVWIQGRATWLFARLYNQVERRPQWLALARQGLEFLRQHCFDADGRMFFLVTQDGRPLRKRRYLFSECFAVFALTEYALAAGDEDAAEQARRLYRLILRYHQEPGLLEPKVNPQVRPMKGLAMPMILLAVTQVLRGLGDDPLYRQVTDGAIHEVLHHFLKPELQALLESVGPNGEFVDQPEGRLVNPGHAIEVARFLLEEARFRGDRSLIEPACRILDWSLAIGWDEPFGGLYYFRDVKNLPCTPYEHDMKLWWPHTEAIYATLLAHHLTGREEYADWHRRIHDWAYAHFPDPRHGEWFGYLHRDGSLSVSLKGNQWKGPFHLPRMQLLCWKLLEEMRP